LDGIGVVGVHNIKIGHKENCEFASVEINHGKHTTAGSSISTTATQTAVTTDKTKIE